jgi:hypothetical protein
MILNILVGVVVAYGILAIFLAYRARKRFTTTDMRRSVEWLIPTIFFALLWMIYHVLRGYYGWRESVEYALAILVIAFFAREAYEIYKVAEERGFEA